MGEKPGWKLTPEEWRTQVITFVSGLASVLAGAAVVGIAIALGRWWSRGVKQVGWVGPVAMTAAAISSALVFTVIAVISLKIKAEEEEHDLETNSKPRQRWGWVFKLSVGLVLGLVWAFAFVVLLAWIGMAAGVK